MLHLLNYLFLLRMKLRRFVSVLIVILLYLVFFFALSIHLILLLLFLNYEYLLNIVLLPFNFIDMEKTCLFFRGRLYKDTFRNRVVGRILTWFYRLKYLFVVLVINVLFFSACSPAVKHESEHFLHSDSLLCDSFSFSGHQYVCFKSHVFQHIEHSPDCACRYNRTFIVIKRGIK